jgi:phage-related protein
MKGIKSIHWIGSAKEELLDFPKEAIKSAGYQLHRLQIGNEPMDWKSLNNLGKDITGVFEIRIWEDKSTFRIAAVTKTTNVVTVLHCWHKKTQTIAKHNKNMIVTRYKEAKDN